jgi:hypothetical protein
MENSGVAPNANLVGLCRRSNAALRVGRFDYLLVMANGLNVRVELQFLANTVFDVNDPVCGTDEAFNGQRRRNVVSFRRELRTGQHTLNPPCGCAGQ